MTDQPTKKAASLFHSENRDLQAILTKVKLLNELTTAVGNYLDDNLKNYCQVANIVGNQLILIAANGSIATQIRFQSTDLLRKFKAHPSLNAIQSIQCKVRPQNTSVPDAIPKKLPPLSAKAASLILEAAQYIEDATVRAALEKIAMNTK